MVICYTKIAPKVICKKDKQAEDVIDLGAPRPLYLKAGLHLPRVYTPNPRLYPPSAPERKSKRPTRRRTKRRSRKLAPNARLYRPPPARPPPPPRRPRAAWAPAAARALDSASRAALRLLLARDAGRGRGRPLGSGSSAPAAALRDVSPAARADAAVMAAGKYSTSPDCSDGNEASSAPSEFLAEFLSAIMRRQYAEALKYCQLILQYEPHNSTARGFYPLLQHKLHALHASRAGDTSSSDDTSSRRGGSFNARFRQESRAEAEAEEMEQGSGSACSSLELDSSASDSPRAPDTTEPSDSASWRWESGGERSERDDNGNPAPPAELERRASPRAGPATEGVAAAARGDVENDNAHSKGSAQGSAHGSAQGSAAGALRRLRASFACSIK